MVNVQSENTLRGRRVLVVEDWLVVAQEIENLLKELGCTVIGAIPRLEKALECARSETFDAAVLDVNLNDEEVYPVADELLMRGIPFVFMTGYDSAALPQEFRQWPRLEKPFSSDEFVRALTKALSMPKSDAQAMDV
jgi:DNA-binding NtrC family response regulator